MCPLQSESCELRKLIIASRFKSTGYCFSYVPRKRQSPGGMKEVSSVDAEVSKGKQIESGYHQKSQRQEAEI